jgi:AcrR family transcriptional regulator
MKKRVRAGENPAVKRKARENARRSANREAILHAAESVLCRQGLDGASMDDVAVEAGFSKATLYRYFDNKAEMVIEILIHFLEDIDGLLREVAARPKSARDRLNDWIVSSLRFLTGKENLTRVFLLDPSFTRLLQAFVAEPNRPAPAGERDLVREIKSLRTKMSRLSIALLEEGIATGEFRRVDARAGAMYLEAVVVGFLAEKLWTDSKTDADRDIRRITDFVLRSVEPRNDDQGVAI